MLDVSLGSEYASDYADAFSIIINGRLHFESFRNILLKYLEQKVQ